MGGTRLWAAAAVFSAALVAGGCGGAKHAAAPTTTSAPVTTTTKSVGDSRYAQQMHAALAPAGNAMLKLRLEVGRVESTQKGLVVATSLRTTERRVRARVAKITPPSNVAVAHRNLLAGFSLLDTQLAALQVSARKGKIGPFLTKAQALANSTAFVRIGAALDAIQARGYPLGL